MTAVPSIFKRRSVRYLGGFAAAAACFDHFNDNIITRTVRTLHGGARIIYLYKYTTPQSFEELSSLHTTVANIILNTCLKNEGLYIKFGQGLSALNHILPPEYITVLHELLDRAPTVPFEAVNAIITEDLGYSVEHVFETFDPVPVASASIAQVHKATIRRPSDGAIVPVAVKVQKPQIRRQIWTDLQAYWVLCYSLKYFFDLPTLWSAKTVMENLTKEIDFYIERDNIAQVRQQLGIDHLENTASSLHDYDMGLSSVTDERTRKGVAVPLYVPKVLESCLAPWHHSKQKLQHHHTGQLVQQHKYAPGQDETQPLGTPGVDDYGRPLVAGDTSKDELRTIISPRVLVLEWIEAHKMTQVSAVREQYRMNEALGTIMRFFAHSIFRVGTVHCDPHPANVLIRRCRLNPSKLTLDQGGHVHHHHKKALNKGGGSSSTYEQVVLIDFGMCINEREEFRDEYARFFYALFTQNAHIIRETVANWGIAHSDLFASLQLQKPFSLSGNMRHGRVTTEDIVKFQKDMHENVKTLLKDEEKVPKELVFIGRCMNLLRALNKMYGSPVNRANIFADEASKIALRRQRGKQQMDGAAPKETFVEATLDWLQYSYAYSGYRLRILLLDLVHFGTLWYNAALIFCLGKDGADRYRIKGGSEGLLERKIEKKAGGDEDGISPDMIEEESVSDEVVEDEVRHSPRFDALPRMETND